MAVRRPELFAAVVLRVPFVDVLSSMLDEHEPMTQLEQGEWGDPIRDADAFARIRAYCPYANIGPACARGPHALVTASFLDTRVPAWQPAKFVARLRQVMPTSENQKEKKKKRKKKK